MAVKEEVTLSTLFHTLWGILLQKYNNTDDAVFGSVTSGRPSSIEGIENMVGLLSIQFQYVCKELIRRFPS